MKHFDRGERRKKAALKKRQARRIYPNDPLARNADHLAECSCHKCGNTRKLYGPTIQELRQPSVTEELRLAETA